MRNGFYHVGIDASVKYTSFVIPLGQFEFLKMPCGGLTRVFQQYIGSIFSDLVQTNKVLIYFDDIMIAIGDIGEYLEILCEVLIRPAGTSYNFAWISVRFYIVKLFTLAI